MNETTYDRYDEMANVQTDEHNYSSHYYNNGLVMDSNGCLTLKIIREMTPMQAIFGFDLF